MSELEAPLETLPMELTFFVETVLVSMWEHRKEARWCTRWAEHPEVINRLLDLYEGWNQVGHGEDELSLNVWYRIYLDHHMPILTAENGPLAACSFDHQEPTAKKWEHDTAVPPAGTTPDPGMVPLVNPG